MYYIPNPKNEKKAMIFLIVLIIVFTLFCVNQYRGQVVRGTDVIDGKKVTCITPAFYRSYVPLNTVDTVMITIMADSIMPTVYSIKLLCLYPKGKKPPQYIQFWYGDKTEDIFDLAESKIAGQSSYYIRGHSMENMFKKPFIAINIEGQAYCETTRGDPYFKDFFAVYDK